MRQIRIFTALLLAFSAPSHAFDSFIRAALHDMGVNGYLLLVICASDSIEMAFDGAWLEFVQPDDGASTLMTRIFVEKRARSYAIHLRLREDFSRKHAAVLRLDYREIDDRDASGLEASHRSAVFELDKLAQSVPISGVGLVDFDAPCKGTADVARLARWTQGIHHPGRGFQGSRQGH
jgi:hypothetical protein